jgi:hypothetical protein
MRIIGNNRAQLKNEGIMCLGYYDENELDGMPESKDNTFMEEGFANDDGLRKSGYYGRAIIMDGPFAETKE